MTTAYQLVFCTCPNAECAQHIAQHLVQAKLAACVNVLPGLTSVYEWQGRIETASEHLLLIKTHARHYAEIENKIKALHPYDLPEIIAVSLEDGLPAYLDWINSCLLPA